MHPCPSSRISIQVRGDGEHFGLRRPVGETGICGNRRQPVGESKHDYHYRHTFACAPELIAAVDNWAEPYNGVSGPMSVPIGPATCAKGCATGCSIRFRRLTRGCGRSYCRRAKLVLHALGAANAYRVNLLTDLFRWAVRGHLPSGCAHAWRLSPIGL